MELTFKQLSIEELKKDYHHNHGFGYQFPSGLSDAQIESMCDTLIKNNITDEYPQFVVRLNDSTIIFVYGDVFDMPTFMRMIDIFNSIVPRVGLIENLYNILK